MTIFDVAILTADFLFFLLRWKVHFFRGQMLRSESNFLGTCFHARAKERDSMQPLLENSHDPLGQLSTKCTYRLVCDEY